jgi:autotransporter-associated beta strand protein
MGGGLLAIDGATFQMDGGTASTATWSYYRNNTVNQTAGAITYNGYLTLLNTVVNLTGGTSGCTGEVMPGYDGGTNVTINIGGTHVADWLVTRLCRGLATINLNSGGILKVDEMSNTGANGVIRFDGGTLAVSTRQPTRASNDWIRTGNSVVIANNGAVMDTAAGSVTINRPLLRDNVSTGGLTKAGANTLTLTALGTYAGGTLVQGGTLKIAPTAVTPTIVNAGFELPAYGVNSWSYLVTDGVTGGWAFTPRAGGGNGGIARSGSPWVVTAPQLLQAGFLQRNCDMAQTVSVPAVGAYRLTFKAANRLGYGAVGLEVKINGVSKGSWAATTIDGGAVFNSYSAELGELQTGAYELRFVGTAPDANDRATAIDDVQIVWLGEALVGSLPIGTQVTIQGGASLDLNGANQSLAGLSGVGEVTNSSASLATLTIGSGNSNTNFFGGPIRGGVSLTKAGAGMLVLSGSNTYSGVTLITGGVLQLPPAGAVVTVANPSFETHGTLANGSYGYNPSGATWVFTAASGISQANDIWIAPTAGIEPTKAGFIQQNGTITGSNTVANAGWYTISFLAGKRPRYTATQLSVEVDGVTQFQFAPGVFTDAGGTFSGNAFLSKGPHELRFRGYATGDTATWIDRIAITAMACSLPTGVVTVAVGATFDLNGHAQTLGGLNGGGMVSNGTLAVSGTIAPGGTNVIGTLTLATTTTLSGTLLIDVASDSSSDLLHVQGNLNVSNLDLQIQNLLLLGSGNQYLIARCTPGGLSGRFRSDNLGVLKAIQYNNASEEIRLVGRGTMITFQ